VPPLRILIASTYYWPETGGPGLHVTGPAEYLAARGHEVAVVTGFPHYPQWRPLVPLRVRATEVHGGVTIRRRWLHIPRSQSAASRALYEGSLLGGGLTALHEGPRPDVILGVMPTLSGGVLAAAAARAFARPYGLLIHDLMGAAADQSGIRGGSRVASTVRRTELSLARRASGLGIIAEGFRDYFEQGGVAADRITRLRMWTLGAEPTESVEESRRRLGWAPDDFVCLHGGNMGQKQALDNLLETAARLRGNGVRLVLAGDGNDRPRLENRAREMGLDNLSFAPVQPWGQYESMLRAADLLIVNQRASVSDMSLPSKLTSYFVTGRPVVAAVAARSETALEVGAAEAGLVVAPEDPEALAEGILLLRRSEDVRRAHGERGRAYADRYLRADSALPEYEQFVRGIARDRPR